MRTVRMIRSLVWVVLSLAATRGGAEESATDLAKQSQNPVADLISLPFQSNTAFGVGPRERAQNVLNVQPVIPLGLNADWNLITRTIIPIVSQPSFVRGQTRVTGIGDTTLSGFLSPKRPAFGKLTWGVGPVLNLPTSSNDRLGSDQWGTGVTAVALASGSKVVFGALVNNVWSLEGRSFSRFLLQPFVNINFRDGWYATSGPIITADWSRQDNAWLVPVGAGFGKVHRIGKLPINLSANAFYNAEKPKYAGDWSLRLSVAILLPK